MVHVLLKPGLENFEHYIASMWDECNCDGIPVELFQILKDDGCESAALNMSANLENSAVATGLEKVSFHSSPKKGNAKQCSNFHTIALISHGSKVMLKILQVRL